MKKRFNYKQALDQILKLGIVSLAELESKTAELKKNKMTAAEQVLYNSYFSGSLLVLMVIQPAILYGIQQYPDVAEQLQKNLDELDKLTKELEDKIKKSEKEKNDTRKA